MAHDAIPLDPTTSAYQPDAQIHPRLNPRVLFLLSDPQQHRENATKSVRPSWYLVTMHLYLVVDEELRFLTP